MAKPIVAIVGPRPNVGKSTIFNKLTGQRLAIVEDTPGVTRDRIFCDCEWSGHKFLLVDTGGIEPRIDDGLLAHMREQAQLAIDSADCIVMVTELSAGVTPQDQDVAGMLMRSGKPVVLAVNKCDKVGEPPMELYDFYSLGLGELIPVSGVHGHGTGDLLDAVCAHLNFEEDEEDTDDRITVAVIGRPNVGKSSLINHILGENRLIVANEAGTTRDAIDTMVENKYGKFIFTDTAGLRKRGKVESGVERYSVLRSLAAVERSRVCVIMIDATVGFTEQDSKSPATRMSRARPASSPSTNGTPSRRTATRWTPCAKSWRRTSASCPMPPSSLSAPRPVSASTNCLRPSTLWMSRMVPACPPAH